MKIFVAGSTQDEIPKKYINKSKELTNYIVKENYDIFCCADERGIIGNIYRKLTKTDKITLAVPKPYLKYAKNITDKKIVTDTIQEITYQLIQQSDIILFFPGGIGTIYELFSSIETKRAGEHSKPIIIVNYFGFFDDILKQLEKIYDEKFANIINKNNYYIANTTKEAINYLKSCV